MQGIRCRSSAMQSTPQIRRGQVVDNTHRVVFNDITNGMNYLNILYVFC